VNRAYPALQRIADVVERDLVAGRPGCRGRRHGDRPLIGLPPRQQPETCRKLRDGLPLAGGIIQPSLGDERADPFPEDRELDLERPTLRNGRRQGDSALVLDRGSRSTTQSPRFTNPRMASENATAPTNFHRSASLSWASTCLSDHLDDVLVEHHRSQKDAYERYPQPFREPPDCSNIMNHLECLPDVICRKLDDL